MTLSQLAFFAGWLAAALAGAIVLLLAWQRLLRGRKP